MFGFGPAKRIYLAAGVTDMRAGFEGLYGLVRDRRSAQAGNPELRHHGDDADGVRAAAHAKDFSSGP